MSQGTYLVFVKDSPAGTRCLFPSLYIGNQATLLYTSYP